MNDINLLPPKDILSQRQHRWRQIALMSTVVVTTFSFLLFGGLIIFGKYQSDQISYLKNKRAALLTDLKPKADLADKLRALGEKARGIKLVRDKEPQYSRRILAINALVPPDFTLLNLSTDHGGTVIMSLSSSNSLAVTNFLRILDASEGAKLIENIRVTGINQGGGGVYSLNIQAKYLNK